MTTSVGNLKYYKTNAQFLQDLSNNKTQVSDLCFIEDIRKIWTHGKFQALTEEELFKLSKNNIYSEDSEIVSDLEGNLVNNLLEGGTDKALSAEMGKELSNKIEDAWFHKTASQVVENGKYLSIYMSKKKINVRIISAPTGRLIISYFPIGDNNAVRLMDNAIVGNEYTFDIDNCRAIIIQNFSGTAGTIEFEVFGGIFQESYRSLSKEVDVISEDYKHISENLGRIAQLNKSSNLFNPDDPDIIKGYYINSEGKVSVSSSYNISGYIPVEVGKTYYFGSNGVRNISRTIEFYDASKKLIAGSFISKSVYEVTAPASAVYMRSSVALSIWDVFQVNESELQPYEKWYEPYETINIPNDFISIDMLSDSVKSVIGVKSFNSFTGESELAQGEVLTLSNVHIGKKSVETAHIEGELSVISIGVGYSDSEEYLNRGYASCWVEIDKTSVKQYRSYNNTDNYTLVDTNTHGLDLTNNTIVEINNDVTSAKLRIYNDKGDSYEQNMQVGVGRPFIINGGTSGIKVKLSFMPQEINRSIWAFGDSYFSFASPDRWPYYLEQNHYTNWLSNNQPGLSPTTALTDLEAILTLGVRPKYILWCLGMNGPTNETTDSEGNYVINSSHKAVIDSVVNLCKHNNITLVLATIPTVPTRQKTGFNNYVRSLGVKYIDFEKAVGTNSSGEWNEGLLSSDGVHPTAAGAKVLASRVLVDFPELTIV